MNQPVNRQRMRAGRTHGRQQSEDRARQSLLQRWRWALVQQLLGLLRSCRISRRPPTVLTAGARSVIGRACESNQDRCYVDHRNGFFVVADGTSGHAMGEQASQVVVEVMAERLGDYVDDPSISLDWIDLEIQQAVRAANHELIAMAERQPELNGIGTTVTAAVIRGGRMLLVAVGNSRAYLLRRGIARQLTRDDTVIQSLLAAGALTPREAAEHPMRRVLMHHVGTDRLQKDLRVQRYSIHPGDRILLTTDGFTDTVTQEGLATLLASFATPQETANALVDHATRVGGGDNITCVVIDAEKADT